MGDQIPSQKIPTPEQYTYQRQPRLSDSSSAEFSSTFSSLLQGSISSTSPPHLTSDWIWSWSETSLSIILGLIVILTILGNFLVLFAFLTRRRDLRSPTHFFVANLALADFLVGVLVLPYLATLQVTDRWYFGQTFCVFWTVTHFWLCSSSILSTCAVCIERYVGVKYPLKHRNIMKTVNVSGMIAGVWILAGILSMSSIFIWPQPPSEDPYQCAINQQIGHVIVATVGILYIPAAIMIILYWRIYIIATRHFNALGKKSKNSGVGLFTTRGGGSDLSTSDTVSGTGSSDVEGGSVVVQDASSSKGISSSNDVATAVNTRKQINLAKRLSILVGVLLLSYVPFFTLYIVMAFHPGSIPIPVFQFFGWIRYFNSCLNPVIYAYAVPAYRKAFVNIVVRRKWLS